MIKFGEQEQRKPAAPQTMIVGANVWCLVAHRSHTVELQWVTSHCTTVAQVLQHGLSWQQAMGNMIADHLTYEAANCAQMHVLAPQQVSDTLWHMSTLHKVQSCIIAVMHHVVSAFKRNAERAQNAPQLLGMTPMSQALRSSHVRVPTKSGWWCARCRQSASLRANNVSQWLESCCVCEMAPLACRIDVFHIDHQCA